MAQIAATSLTRVYHQVEKVEQRNVNIEFAHDIIDLYLKLNHPQAYEEVSRYRESIEMDERDPDADLIAEDMSGLLAKVMAMEG